MQNAEKAALENKLRELEKDLKAEKWHHRYWHAVATAVLSVLAFEIAFLIGMAFIAR